MVSQIFSVMRVGAYALMARRSFAGEEGTVLDPLDWLRMGTLAGAKALGLDATSTDGLDLNSREAGSTTAPKLVLTLG